jgi:transglutaminase-like putative cysteine protease
LDPTNGIVVADEHVVLGWGRDFGDVSPIRGVITGGGSHTVKVSVDLVQASGHREQESEAPDPLSPAP